MSTTLTLQIDVRTLLPRHRHALIFQHFDELKTGEAMELLNDHDPMPLRYQLESRAPGSFSWTYLQSGPALWQVRIVKAPATATAAAAAAVADSCCSGGACGG